MEFKSFRSNNVSKLEGIIKPITEGSMDDTWCRSRYMGRIQKGKSPEKKTYQDLSVVYNICYSLGLMKKFSFLHVQWLRTAGRHLYNKQYFTLQQSNLQQQRRWEERNGLLRCCALGLGPGVVFHGGVYQSCSPGL